MKFSEQLTGVIKISMKERLQRVLSTKGLLCKNLASIGVCVPAPMDIDGGGDFE